MKKINSHISNVKIQVPNLPCTRLGCPWKRWKLCNIRQPTLVPQQVNSLAPQTSAV